MSWRVVERVGRPLRAPHPLLSESSWSAAAAGAAAAFADVAGAGGAHLGAAGHAERGVDGGAGDLLEELGARVGLLDLGVWRRLLRNILDHRRRLDDLGVHHLSLDRGRREIADDLGGSADLLEWLIRTSLEIALALVGGEDA